MARLFKRCPLVDGLRSSLNSKHISKIKIKNSEFYIYICINPMNTSNGKLVVVVFVVQLHYFERFIHVLEADHLGQTVYREVHKLGYVDLTVVVTVRNRERCLYDALRCHFGL